MLEETLGCEFQSSAVSVGLFSCPCFWVWAAPALLLLAMTTILHRSLNFEKPLTAGGFGSCWGSYFSFQAVISAWPWVFKSLVTLNQISPRGERRSRNPRHSCCIPALCLRQGQGRALKGLGLVTSIQTWLLHPFTSSSSPNHRCSAGWALRLEVCSTSVLSALWRGALGLPSPSHPVSAQFSQQPWVAIALTFLLPYWHMEALPWLPNPP